MSSHLMKTASGRLVDALALRPDDICLKDIFTALSTTCRFNGHAPVTVAQHSLGVSELLRLRKEEPIVQLRGLMHDALETYLPDITRPHKRRAMFRGFQDMEDRVLRSIWMALGLGDPETYFSTGIHRADTDMGYIEGDRYFPEGITDWPTYSPEAQAAVDKWAYAVGQFLPNDPEEIRWKHWADRMGRRYIELADQVVIRPGEHHA